MSKKKSQWIPNYGNPPTDCPIPSVYGKDKDYRPDYTNISLINQCGIVVGAQFEAFPTVPVGISQGKEGNLLVVGANGSGKSRCIAKTTLITWKDALVALDIKGELYAHYLMLYKTGIVKRKPILFDPTKADGMCYDPLRDIKPDSDEMIELLWDIVMAIYPSDVKEVDPFWRNSERNILMASLVYYLDLGLSFIEIIIKVVSSTIDELCKDINSSYNNIAKMYIGDLSDLDPKNRASFSCGLRNTLSQLASNPYFAKAFCSDEDSGHFGWSDLEDRNIFIRVPEDKIEQWSIPVRIIFNQLLRYLMRRPDKYSPDGANNIQTLLLLDELARFGKIELVTNAIATLRSKSVNICIMLQRIDKLDRIYGIYDKRIICDNCQYKAILNVNDVESQKYFSDLVGTVVKRKEDYTDIEDICGDIDSTSRHYSYRREPVIYPHEFATLNDILFHTPYGFYRLDKIMPEDMISSKAQETTAPNKSGENVIKGTAVISKSKPED